MQSGAGSDSAMGLFINTLPVRVDVGGSVREAVRLTHDRLASLMDHEHASLSVAQQCSGVAQGTPLFGSILNVIFESLSRENASIYPGIVHVEFKERTNYPVSLTVEDYGSSYGLTADVISPVDPSRITGYMEQALQSLMEAIELTTETDVRELGVLPAEERSLLLNTWNATAMEYPEDLCVHNLVEQHAERAPDATAVVFMDQSLTYRELNERANRLAHHLVRLGVQPDTRVAICVDRSLAMVVGVLAVLKAGGAYVPLDPTYASDRMGDILSDARPSIVIADNVGQTVLGEERLSLVTVVDPNSVPSNGHDSERYVLGVYSRRCMPCTTL
jgi:non-ribosomal peptide synthetase component F